MNKKKEFIEFQERPLFNFGDALNHLKEGRKVSRIGWNGKGMFLVLAYPDYKDGRNNASVQFNKSFDGVGCHLENFIAMKTADNKLIPWLASQADVLAEDWTIVE